MLKTFTLMKITRERANAIYYRDYWKYNGIDTLPDEIVGIVFDNAVIQGQGTAIQNVHKSLDIVPGAIIGPTTLKKLENTDYSVFINRFKNYAKSRVNEIIDNDDSQSIFKNGWNNRISKY
ncbi:MAG: hypothetical protein E7016_07550 [Alphaproteobacteria bacterium]|nr:hypothetical protein [Alphaproteobacteria bacterium]